jgi:hypothetical protein
MPLRNIIKGDIESGQLGLKPKLGAKFTEAQNSGFLDL